MFRKQLFVLTFFISFPAFAQKELKEIYQKKAETYLVKSASVFKLFEIDDEGVKMYTSSKNKELQKPEFALSWEDVPHFCKMTEFGTRDEQLELYRKIGTKSFDNEVISKIESWQSRLNRGKENNKPLSGVRVAIDPGHIAGSMKVAKMESRFVNIKLESGRRIELSEGVLSLTTALILRDSLQALGATVMLTRDKPNQTAKGKSIDSWLKEELKKEMKIKGLSQKQINKEVKSRNTSALFADYFVAADLKARAAKINHFHPDMTVIIHYNVDVDNAEWSKPTDNNYGMVFVPGAVIQGELTTMGDRLDFLRMLLTDQIPESVKLSECLAFEIENHLKVPLIKESEEPIYLTKYAIKLGKGVYARNLKLSQYISSPLCYGEPLLQDNKDEILALSQNDFQAHRYAPRVGQVANAYLKAVKKYAKYLKMKGKI